MEARTLNDIGAAAGFSIRVTRALELRDLCTAIQDARTNGIIVEEEFEMIQRVGVAAAQRTGLVDLLRRTLRFEEPPQSHSPTDAALDAVIHSLFTTLHSVSPDFCRDIKQSIHAGRH